MDLRNIYSLIDKQWTLFLDRDGVINTEIEGTYVTCWEDFRFEDGVLDSMPVLSEIFGNIIVVTNQRGVGRGIMSFQSLKEIHRNMTGEITARGGRVDRIYTCTAVQDEDRNRKPNTGMALQAREDFPSIDFRKCIIVGNSLSDMEFGKRLCMHTVFLTTKHAPFALPHDLIDEQFPSLKSWTNMIPHAELVG